jgi:hypothetical protein
VRVTWALFVLLVAAAPAAAGDLAKREKAVLGKVGAATRRFAKLLAERKEYASAREELRRFLLLDPEDEATLQQLQQLVKKGRATDAGTDVSVPRRAAQAECTKALLDFAAECERANDPERLWRAWTAAVVAYGAKPPDGAEWFPPYCVWVRKEDKARLDAGGEFVDGKWLDAAAVEALSASHKASKGEWVFDDGIHVVETAEPLRSARRVLWQASAFRRFFLSYFACLWDLRPPKGKLPILFTGTQDEMKKKMRKHDPSGADEGVAAALYLWSSVPLNPCFVTLEPMLASGKPVMLTFEEIEPVLRHELAHQIAFEYSRHADPDPKRLGPNMWVYEGMAEFFSCYALGPEGWRIQPDHPALVRCRENIDAMPKVADFIAIQRDGYNTVLLYAMGAGLYWFLWQSEEHRASLARLTELAHTSKGTASSFKECFKGVDPASLQPAWEKFARTAGQGDAPKKAPEGDEGLSEGCG